MDGRYYWLKLKRDFFKRHDIRIIEDLPNGKDYILFYLKLLCESVDHEGKLRFSESIPYSDTMLSTITNTNIDVVRSAIKAFTELDMMEILDDGTFYMREVEKMIGSGADNDNANRQRRFREAQKAKALEVRYDPVTKSNADVTECVTKDNESKSKNKSKNKSIEKEIDIDIEKDSSSGTTTTKRFVKPTLEEVKAYVAERGNRISADQFHAYYEANGWQVGRRSMKDWKAAVRYWEQGEKKAPQRRGMYFQDHAQSIDYQTYEAQAVTEDTTDEDDADLMAMLRGKA